MGGVALYNLVRRSRVQNFKFFAGSSNLVTAGAREASVQKERERDGLVCLCGGNSTYVLGQSQYYPQVSR